jgi:hypothetical protein
MFIDNDTRALAAMVVDPLTAPDKEDWTIIPDGDRVHMVAYREHDGTAVMMHGEPVPMCEFRRAVRELPPGHDLGVVMAVICPDQRRRGIELVAWLNKMARRKGFSLMSVHGSATTEEAVAAMAEKLREVGNETRPQ